MAHIGHAELLTPTPEASLEYFTTLLGMSVVLEQHGSWYLRGYGDYEPYCLKPPETPAALSHSTRRDSASGDQARTAMCPSPAAAAAVSLRQ